MKMIIIIIITVVAMMMATIRRVHAGQVSSLEKPVLCRPTQEAESCSSVAHHVMQHVLVHVPFTRHTAQDLMQRAARAWMNAKAWLVALSAMVLVSGSSNSF